MSVRIDQPRRHAVSVQIHFLCGRTRCLHHLVIRTDLEKTAAANGESFDNRMIFPHGDDPAVVIDGICRLRSRQRASEHDEDKRAEKASHNRRLQSVGQ